MKNMNKFNLIFILFAIVLAGCSTKSSDLDTGALVDADCVITNASYNHIHARHCVADQGSRFIAAYCTLQGMQTFCRMVQQSPNKVRVVQANGRVRYDANLGVVVGTQGEKCGRLVITSQHNGTVITQFPEFGGGAPGSCN